MPEHLVIRHPPPPPRLRRPSGCESWCFCGTPGTPPGCAPPGRCRRPLCSRYPVASGRTRDTGLMDRCGRRPPTSQDGGGGCLYSSQVVLLAVCGLPHGSGFACCTLPYLLVGLSHVDFLSSVACSLAAAALCRAIRVSRVAL